MGRWGNLLPSVLPMVGITGGVQLGEGPFFSPGRPLKWLILKVRQIILKGGHFAIFQIVILFFVLVR